MNIIRPTPPKINGSATTQRSKQKLGNIALPNPELEDLTPPASRGFRVVPEIFVLERLIQKALNALKKGVYWDRGSIINIEV